MVAGTGAVARPRDDVPRKSISLLLKPSLLKNRASVKVFFAVPLTVQEAHHIIAAWIRNCRQREFLQIPPVIRVARIVEMLRSEIGVKAIRERIVCRSDMASSSSGSFEDSYLVAAPHQLVRAGKPGYSGADYNYLLLHPTDCAANEFDG